MAKRDPRLKAYVKYDKYGQVVPGSLILRRTPPESGRGYYWKEVTNDICCSGPISNYEFTLNSGSALFSIEVNDALVVNTDNTEGGTFAAGSGDTVDISLTGEGPFKTLLVIDDTTGVILSNQTGTTGDLTYTYVAPALHTFTVVATSGPTTTTTTTTTTTSTTTTTTSSTTTTTTTP